MAAEISRLRRLLSDSAVCKLASSLNNGKSCAIEHPTQAVGHESLTGCANYHARIRFSNGSPCWLIRIPRVTGFAVGLPVSLADYLVRSEYATLKFLETARVPAPKAFFFGLPPEGNDHGIGVPFLMIEEMPGKTWDGESNADAILESLANILVELEQYPFDKIGSLWPESPGEAPCVFAVSSDRFVGISPFGPFETSAAYYTAWTEQYLILIANGQLYPQFPVDAYLAYRFLQENVAQLHDTDDQNFLTHVDDKGDHLLVDENLNITGIIDWQMARVVPWREAFALSLVTADMTNVFEGLPQLSENDVDFQDIMRRLEPRLAEHMGDEKMRRFLWGLGLESEWRYALPFANAILRIFGVKQEWEEWKQSAVDRYGNDDRLSALIQASALREEY